MNLILTFASAFYVMHVGDRLVTVTAKEFDPVANKNVIYLERDAVATIGYTGRAYVDQIPTDQWLAEKLAARGPKANTQGDQADCRPIPKWPKLAKAGYRLPQELNTSFSKFCVSRVECSGFRRVASARS